MTARRQGVICLLAPFLCPPYSYRRTSLENDVEQNYGKAMEKLWLRCETISDGNAMEKSRDYDEEVG